MQFAAFAETDGELDPGPFEVEIERDQGEALLVQFDAQFVDLLVPRGRQLALVANQGSLRLACRSLAVRIVPFPTSLPDVDVKPIPDSATGATGLMEKLPGLQGKSLHFHS